MSVVDLSSPRDSPPRSLVLMQELVLALGVLLLLSSPYSLSNETLHFYLQGRTSRTYI